MREDVDNPYAKIQNLASTFNLPPSVYTTESLNTKLDCFLCSKNITAKNDSNKRNTKKVVAKLLIEHLIKNHWS